MLCVAGLTAAVLMHHSRRAFGNVPERYSGSGVGPLTANTSRISTSPLAEGWGSICVALGSRSAILFSPSPSPIA